MRNGLLSLVEDNDMSTSGQGQLLLPLYTVKYYELVVVYTDCIHDHSGLITSHSAQALHDISG